MLIWKKLGRIFNPRDYHNLWFQDYAQAPSTLLFDDFIRVYFSCRPPRDNNGQFISYSTYLDLAKNDLFKILKISSKPILALGDRGCFDEFGTYPVSVIRHNDSLFAYYAGWTSCKSVPFTVAIGCAKSYNQGKTFEKISNGPIMGASLYDPCGCGGPKIRFFNGKFYLFYISVQKWLLIDGRNEIVHRIRVAISDDGIKYNRINKNLIPTFWDKDESQASPDVFYKNGKYHMFFCGWNPNNFRHTGFRTIGYAFSTDLINWIRDDSKAGITISKASDAFDNEMVAYPHIFELNNKIYMLYLGNEVGRYGFGLAELEGDLD